MVDMVHSLGSCTALGASIAWQLRPVGSCPSPSPPPPSHPASESAELRNDDPWNASSVRRPRPASSTERERERYLIGMSIDRSDRSEAEFSAGARRPICSLLPRFIYSLLPVRFKLHSFHPKDEINKDEIGRLIIRERAAWPCQRITSATKPGSDFSPLREREPCRSSSKFKRCEIELPA